MLAKQQLLTPKETSQRLHLSKSSVYSLVEEGRLEHYRIGARGKRGKILIPEEAIEEFLLSCRGNIDD
jgi:excisionase family DNA binding protein